MPLEPNKHQSQRCEGEGVEPEQHSRQAAEARTPQTSQQDTDSGAVGGSCLLLQSLPNFLKGLWVLLAARRCNTMKGIYL